MSLPFFRLCFLGLLLCGQVLNAQDEIQRLHSIPFLDQVDVYRARHQFQDAFDSVNELLGHDLTPYERGWTLWKKATILPQLYKEGSCEALEILNVLLTSYVSEEVTDENKIFVAAILYEQSKAFSKLGDNDLAIEVLKQAIQIASTAHYAYGSKTFYIEQMSLRIGRYLFRASPILHFKLDRALVDAAKVLIGNDK